MVTSNPPEPLTQGWIIINPSGCSHLNYQILLVLQFSLDNGVLSTLVSTRRSHSRATFFHAYRFSKKNNPTSLQMSSRHKLLLCKRFSFIVLLIYTKSIITIE